MSGLGGVMTNRRERVASQLGLIGFSVVCTLGWAAVLAAPDEALAVVLPMLAVLAVAGGAVIALWDRRGGGPSLFEIGTVYVAVVSLYALFPLLAFLVNGLRYTPFSHGRLFAIQPTPRDIGVIAWYYVVHLTAFVLVYVLVRGDRAGAGVRPIRVSRPTLLTVLFLYLAVEGFFFFLRLSFDLTSSTYVESYLVSQRLPLVLAQLMNHLLGIKFTLQLMFLAALFTNYRRCRLVIAGWLVGLVAATFVQLGSRTELMLLLMAAALMYHRLVRPIRVSIVVVMGLAALVMFNWLGTLRAGHLDSPAAGEVNPIFGYSSEFEVIFANAFELNRLVVSGDVPDIPASMYFAELLTLIPQQLSPVIKVDPAVWYVNTFYPDYAATGGGLAFGTIAQSVLGGGWIELVARGAMLGLLLGLVHRYWVRRRTSVWAFTFYVWATVLVYQSFRHVTFSLLALFVYRFLPVWLLVMALSAIWMKTPSSRGRGRFERGASVGDA